MISVSVESNLILHHPLSLLVLTVLIRRKLDFLVKELRKFDVVVAGIQETKWFGQDVWNVNEYTLLHLGCNLPDDGEPLIRNEGVGIVLDQCVTAALKNVGECWEAVSSGIVTAILRIAQRGQRQCAGSRWTSSRCLSLVSIYAPTAKAPPGVKATFADDFQSSCR